MRRLIGIGLAIGIGTGAIRDAAAESSAEAKLSEIVVVAPADSTHATTASAGTLVPADPVETPLAVEVLPQPVLESRYVTSVYEALDQVSGVFTGGKSSFTVSAGRPTIRGFGGNDVLLDGLVLPARMPIFFDAAGLGGVEFYKGPLNSAQGGQSGLQGSGGGVNLLGKMPDFDGSFTTLSLGSTFGNGASGRLTADPNWVVAADLALRAPFAAAYEEPFYLPGGIDGDRSVAAAPAGRWKIGADTLLTLATTYQNTERAAYQGIPYLKGDFLVPLDTYYGDDDSRDEYEGFTAQTRLDHAFSDDFKLALGAGYARADEQRTHWSVSANAQPADGLTTPAYYDRIRATRTARFSYTDGDHLDENVSVFTHLSRDLDWGAARHRLLLGADFLRRQTSSESAMGTTDWLDLDAPALAMPALSSGIGATETEVDRAGFLFQDFASWKQWRLLAGTRLDRHESDTGRHAWASSPRLGLTFLVQPDFALYGNATLAEGPNFGYLDVDGHELDDPWRSEQFELGAKKRFFDNLWWTVAVFQITQKDVPELDPADPSNASYVLGGENRSRGVETSLSGEIHPDWSWWGSYTYCEYEDVDAGIDFERFPAHSASLWTAYRIAGGPLRGLKPGIGLRAKSKWYTTFRGTYLGDDYEINPSAVVDLACEYPLACWSSPNGIATKLEFGVKNLFDEEYVESNRHGTENFPGQPQTFWTRLTTTF